MAWRKPSTKRVGLKVFAMGETSSGKTFFGLTFPNIALIDSEAGASFYENKAITIGDKRYQNIVVVDTTADLDSLEENLDSIIEGDVEGIDTIIIDSETKFFVNAEIGITEVEERKAKQLGREVDGWAKNNRLRRLTQKMQLAKLTASAKGINIVSTAQAKAEKDKQGNITGWKPDVHASLPFDYDIILRFYTEVDKKTKKVRHFAEVLKDRTETYKKYDIIEDATYDNWSGTTSLMKDCEVLGSNLSQDLKNSSASILFDAENSGEIAEEIKEILKGFNSEQKSIAKAKFDAKEIKLAKLDTYGADVLSEMLSFIKDIK